MKVRAFRATRLTVATLAQGRSILRGTVVQMRTRWVWAVVAVVAAILLGLLLWPHEWQILHALRHIGTGPEKHAAREVAWSLGAWGDYPIYNLLLALVIWLYGVFTRSLAWRRAAVVCLMGATLAGLCTDFLRLTLGRPRPDSHLPDGFYGLPLALKGGYQSFPSGHAASTVGAAVALLFVDLPLGVITSLFAVAVMWARLYIYRHYPSDVMTGAIIGLYFGLVTGLGSRRRTR